MITKTEAKKLRLAIKASVQAQVALSWVGAPPSEERDDVERHARVSTARLRAFIKSITRPPITRRAKP